MKWCSAVTTLASCGFAGGDSDGSGTTLNVLVPSYSDNTQGLWEGIIQDFEAENDDITVKLEVQSWDNLNDVVTTKIQGNKAPDIMNGGPFAGFAADGLLYPMACSTRWKRSPLARPCPTSRTPSSKAHPSTVFSTAPR